MELLHGAVQVHQFYEQPVYCKSMPFRSINKSAYNNHTEPLFKFSNIMKIEDVYKYKMALFMFDFSHGRLPL